MMRTLASYDYRTVQAHDVYVTDAPKREAMKRLRERMDAGETPFEILGICEDHKYYVDKLLAGHLPMSYAIYGRIMNLAEEDDFSE